MVRGRAAAPRYGGRSVFGAVYGLLEDHLGCHWFTPGKIGECIPRRNDGAQGRDPRSVL
jgi:hypothetical protein